MLADAAKAFATGVAEGVLWVEELGIRGMQYLNSLGIAFGDLSSVANAFGNDIKGIAANSAQALYSAYHEAIQGIAQEFRDLGDVASRAMHFDLSGARTAFASLGTDAEASMGRVRAALRPDLFAGTSAAMEKMRRDAAAESAQLDKVTASLEKQTKATVDLIATGGRKAPPSTQTQDAGNPKAPDDDDDKKKDALEAKLKELDAEVKAVEDAEKRKAMLLDAGVKLKEITENEKVAKTQDALQDELQDVTALYQKELALAGLSLSQKQEILNKMQAAQAKYNDEVLKLNIQAAEASQKTWDEATSKINSAFTGQIDGLLKGTTTFGQAFKNIFASLTEDLLKFFVTWSLEHAETIAKNILGLGGQTTAQIAATTTQTTAVMTGETAKTAATTAGETARIGVVDAGAAAQGMTTIEAMSKSILASAQETVAGVTGFLSPILGPAAIGVGEASGATVAALASALPSFDVGAWSLPSNMIAQVHAGEMIVPAGPAALMRAAAGGGTSGGGGHTFNFHINGAQSPQQTMRHIKDNIRGVARLLNQHTALNPTTRPAT